MVIRARPAGATFVKALAAMPGARDKVTVTAIEQNEVWTSGPPHADFVIGIRKVEEVIGNVKSAVVDPKVVRLVQARVVSVDPANRVVKQTWGGLPTTFWSWRRALCWLIGRLRVSPR